MEEKALKEARKGVNACRVGLCNLVARLSWASPPNLSVFASLFCFWCLCSSSVRLWRSWLLAWLSWSGSLRFSCAWVLSGSEDMAATQVVLAGLAVCSVDEYSVDTGRGGFFNGSHVQSIRLMVHTQKTCFADAI